MDGMKLFLEEDSLVLPERTRRSSASEQGNEQYIYIYIFRDILRTFCKEGKSKLDVSNPYMRQRLEGFCRVVTFGTAASNIWALTKDLAQNIAGQK